MGRSPKPPPPNAIARMIVSRNVVAAMNQKWSQLANKTAREKALAKAAGVKPATVQRVIAASNAATIDTIEALAEALGTSPAALLTPYAGARTAPTDGEQDASEGHLQRRRS